MVLLSLFVLANPANANAPDPAQSALCDSSARRAAREYGIPINVLLAITRTETARFGAPWPWTVNMEGDGYWFDTRSEALDFATRRHSGGARSFDVGCFQINYRWHGEHFQSISAMFEPDENARYAARFLTELYAELGSWEAAVGAYHSRTERFAARYLRIYHGHLEALGADPEMPAPGAGTAVATNNIPPPRANTFPLLQTGGETTMGSLVPSTASSSQPLLGARP